MRFPIADSLPGHVDLVRCSRPVRSELLPLSEHKESICYLTLCVSDPIELYRSCRESIPLPVLDQGPAHVTGCPVPNGFVHCGPNLSGINDHDKVIAWIPVGRWECVTEIAERGDFRRTRLTDIPSPESDRCRFPAGANPSKAWITLDHPLSLRSTSTTSEFKACPRVSNVS